jgi:predicted nicotinamide N-methyase
MIERRIISLRGQTVIELGAATALPSMLAASLEQDCPVLTTVTDYPDDIIMGNLRKNIDGNRTSFIEGCAVFAEPYEWGKDVHHLLYVARMVGVL